MEKQISNNEEAQPRQKTYCYTASQLGWAVGILVTVFISSLGGCYKIGQDNGTKSFDLEVDREMKNLNKTIQSLENEISTKTIAIDSLRQRSDRALNILGSTRYDGVSCNDSDRRKFQTLIENAGSELSRNKIN